MSRTEYVPPKSAALSQSGTFPTPGTASRTPGSHGHAVVCPSDRRSAATAALAHLSLASLRPEAKTGIDLVAKRLTCRTVLVKARAEMYRTPAVNQPADHGGLDPGPPGPHP